jgi:hypothetical protein
MTEQVEQPTYLERAVEAAMVAAVGGVWLCEGEEVPDGDIDIEAAVKAAEPHIRTDERRKVREALQVEADLAADAGDRFLAQAFRDVVTALQLDEGSTR